MKLGERIRKKRLYQAKSLRDLANELNVNFTALSRIEEGKRPAPQSPDRAEPYANYLGIDVTAFIHEAFVEKHDIVDERYSYSRLGVSDIETVAERDRNTFLRTVGRGRVSLPKDLKLIPRILFDLEVIEDEILFSNSGRRVYAGLFPGDFAFQNTLNSIAVATQSVRSGRDREVGIQTRMFHVMHEVGHYRMHYLGKSGGQQSVTDRPLLCSSGDRDHLEQDANHYAAAFLMPKHEIISGFGYGSNSILSEHLAEAAAFFGVERYMLTNRLSSLGIKII